MSVLDKILMTKREEVARLHERRVVFDTARPREIHSLRAALLAGSNLGVIAEIKRKSPSKGTIQADINPAERAQVYERAGATAISVLTDEKYFGGSIEDLRSVRDAVSIPLLRKDFIIDEIQIDEAYAAGADVVLLIAAALRPKRLRELSAYAQHLGLDVLLEVHGVDELDAALDATPSILGINNRNLHTFDVDLGTTEDVIQALPKDVVVISESGIFGTADAQRMVDAGARGILVGELLMRHADLGDVAKCLTSLQVEAPSVDIA
ncbi:indole-3-glycerol phosphate synthase TrpC [Alicyclobacillus fastidiosus]|uniref:Indole-3-glycerol phosphate synthase n=1 Tax=Alicyclobacillus fastidiosus TaxID=392011 RepID=A0ABY6Z9X9_9BACL|nr:indole-3-glycerol phosphate synthase TrpC [Alicyclobacillus fastidiosus]WAH39661.1 indole-3-glycerol phosphate synthase TrpC [Alicyclobacillus fastidiosus]GMA60870.1 indole-3-glycerol phosphate synthase [Alicyclobacillus fastidiosus]